jgi:hypothetical protein
MSRMFKFYYDETKTTGTLHKDLHIFMIITPSALLRMRGILDKSCRENQNTDFMFTKYFPKIVPFVRQCAKMLYSQRVHRRQFNTAHAHFMLHN